jgi:phage gpG-like protein
MTPEELPAFLRGLQGTVADAAAPAANSMAATVAWQARINLNLAAHAPGIFWKAPEGRPPARASGNLAASMITIPSYSRVRATSVVGNTAIYAAIQEFGGWTEPTRHKFMHWTNDQGRWYLPHVDIPEHSYIRVATERTILDGSLQRSAMSSFISHMSPVIR